MRVTPTREDRDFRPDLFGEALVRAAAAAGIFAFGVLAHDDPVEIADADIAQGRGHARQNLGRTDIGVLIKALADRQAKAPQRDVVGDIGRADRAEIDRVEFFQLGEPVGGHHDAVLPVIVGAPVEGFHGEGEIAGALRQRLQHADAG
jgi:hypothetical protein